jgi:hypothetical protein
MIAETKREKLFSDATKEIMTVCRYPGKDEAKEIQVLRINILLLKEVSLLPNNPEIYDKLNLTIANLEKRLFEETMFSIKKYPVAASPKSTTFW